MADQRIPIGHSHLMEAFQLTNGIYRYMWIRESSSFFFFSSFIAGKFIISIKLQKIKRFTKKGEEIPILSVNPIS